MKPAALALTAFAALSMAVTVRAQDTATTNAGAIRSAPRPYVDSFPVSHSAAQRPAAQSTTAAPAVNDSGGLRLLPTVKPTNAPKSAAQRPTTASAVPAGTGTHPAQTTAGASTQRSAMATFNALAVQQHSTAASATPATQTKPAGSAANAAPAAAMAPAGPVYGPFNRGVIVLDPAHGGVDSGSRLTDSLSEKDVTLALAFKLRSLLQARGFSVVLTRDSDAATEANNPGTALTLDDRAGIANHARPVACLLLHATASGTGVHLYRSELSPVATEATMPNWLTAQAPWVNTSEALSQRLAEALERSHLPHVTSAASVRPVDSLTCPALVLELAPQDSGDASTAGDPGYQTKVAEALATALVFWRNQAKPPQRADDMAAAQHAAAPASASAVGGTP